MWCRAIRPNTKPRIRWRTSWGDGCRIHGAETESGRRRALDRDLCGARLRVVPGGAMKYDDWRLKHYPDPVKAEREADAWLVAISVITTVIVVLVAWWR